MRPLTFVVLVFSTICSAQREPVLKQIDLPHPYYYREMYLPQLTTGPSAAAWSPDSKTLVYSMAGSLWRQGLVSPVAEQLTSGPGYDYQPDWSSDGRWIVFVRYDHDALELWCLDTINNSAHQLTSAGAVNIEPRFSPDGRQLAFVSTSQSGHFHIFIGQFEAGELSEVRQLTTEHVSSLPRYYYSKVDHEISPVWSRDGTELLFVSNRGHIHGTGGFWRVKITPGSETREIHYEETNWKARPDFSPDGRRIIFASYLGREWHQLWLMPAEGGDAFPISYGEFDNTNPRWSPDGSKIVFISNRDGNTSLWVMTIPGGAQTKIVPLERKYRTPVGQLSLKVLDSDDHPIAARVFLTSSDGRTYAPDDAWLHADDSFTRSERGFEAHYFDTLGPSTITVPAGEVQVVVMRGFNHRLEQRKVSVNAGETKSLTVHVTPLAGDFLRDWTSGDLHAHMNYGGTYRNTPQHLLEQADAEDLPIVENLVVNKEQRVPDISYFSSTADSASTAEHQVFYGQEFHTSFWGHIGLLSLQTLILPGYAVYPNTASASLYPTNGDVADMAHRQGALVGYVHPFDNFPDPIKDESLTEELPADVALGKIDYIEVLGFSDHKSTAEVWYKLLNCGFRLPAGAGTDFMGNYASLRGPVGLNRVYAEVPDNAQRSTVKMKSWLAALKAGRTFATNGPLLSFSLGGAGIGGQVQIEAKDSAVPFSAELASIVPIDHLQIVCNGKLARELPLSGNRTSTQVSGSISLDSGGWCLLRAFSDKAEFPILDLYPYATTSPIYIALPGTNAPHHSDAEYFVSWMQRLMGAAESSSSWNTEAEKQSTLTNFEAALRIYESLLR